MLGELFDPQADLGHWPDVRPNLDTREQNEFKSYFNRCQEDLLDQCQGECVLRQPEMAKIVADSLLHFDGDRYTTTDAMSLSCRPD